MNGSWVLPPNMSSSGLCRVLISTLVIVGLFYCVLYAEVAEKILQGDSNTLYDIVDQGILENCRKFECGALTWNLEQRGREIDGENTRDIGQQDVGQIWWDGEKVATRTTTSWIGKYAKAGDEGKETIRIKVYDGNEYRWKVAGVPHIMLDKKPRFNQFDNYLQDYGWPGHSNSIVEKLADDMNNKRISMEWSIAETDGNKFIKVRKAYKDLGDDYYEIFYFDPAKSCMFVKIEVYQKNELDTVATWTLEQVQQGLWFPVEFNHHGELITPDGRKIQYTTHYKADLEKSTFNNRSAIPEGTFKLEITPDINIIIDHRLGEPPTIYQGKEVGEFLKQGCQGWSVLVSEGNCLPGFDGIKIDLGAEKAKNKIMLVCFFDINQRPSRNCLLQLSTKAQELMTKDVVVVAVQASKVDDSVVNEWVEKNNIPFTIGMIQGDEEKIRFTWGVRSPPWLILTDKKQTVTAEGFAINELDEKIKNLNE